MGVTETILQRLIYCLDTEIVASKKYVLFLLRWVSHNDYTISKIRTKLMFGTEKSEIFSAFK